MDHVTGRGACRRPRSGPLIRGRRRGAFSRRARRRWARVQPHILELAEKQAARIYKHAGATMVWRAAHETVVDAGFTVRLVIQAEFRGVSGAASPFLMGAAPETAVECGGVPYLFFDRIMAFSNIMLRNPARVLGTVAAHEVGHVLLRPQGHSTEGLMRASWKPDDWERAASGASSSRRPNGWPCASGLGMP